MFAVAGDGEFLRLLAERGVEANSSGHYYGCAFQAAARFGHLECVHLLLNADAEANLGG
jgi:ankyrin repeat protein